MVLDGFVRTAGAGQVLHETRQPLRGAGSLRLVLAEKASELRVVSTEFPVEPWNLYHISMRKPATSAPTCVSTWNFVVRPAGNRAPFSGSGMGDCSAPAPTATEPAWR